MTCVPNCAGEAFGPTRHPRVASGEGCPKGACAMANRWRSGFFIHASFPFRRATAPSPHQQSPFRGGRGPSHRERCLPTRLLAHGPRRPHIKCSIACQLQTAIAWPCRHQGERSARSLAMRLKAGCRYTPCVARRRTSVRWATNPLHRERSRGNLRGFRIILFEKAHALILHATAMFLPINQDDGKLPHQTLDVRSLAFASWQGDG